MKPYISQSVVVFGGLENSLFEHAAIVTFVHRAKALYEGQMGAVNVRVMLDSFATDRVLKFVPLFPTRRQAIEYNAMGAGYCAYIPNPHEPEIMLSEAESKDDPIPPFGTMAAVTLPHAHEPITPQ